MANYYILTGKNLTLCSFFPLVQVLSRVGQTCTHIVYKNGLASTLTKYKYVSLTLSRLSVCLCEDLPAVYRLLDEPRPKVVGIGWVVECAEKRARVDESRFQVDLEGINVAGALKVFQLLTVCTLLLTCIGFSDDAPSYLNKFCQPLRMVLWTLS